MTIKKKHDVVELPENWAELPEEEQDAFLDALIERWIPKPEAGSDSE